MGDQDADRQLSRVVEQRLPGEQVLTHAGGRVRPLDRGHHQDLVDRRLQHAARGRGQGPGQHPGLDAGRGPGQLRFDHVKRRRGHPVGQAHRRGGEHAAVHQGGPDAPLHQGHPGDRHQEPVEGRQQQGQRQLPDRVHVLDQARGLAGPVGQLHRQQVAGEQDRGQLQVRAAEPGDHGAQADHGQIRGDHGRDETQ